MCVVMTTITLATPCGVSVGDAPLISRMLKIGSDGYRSNPLTSDDTLRKVTLNVGKTADIVCHAFTDNASKQFNVYSKKKQIRQSLSATPTAHREVDTFWVKSMVL